MANVGDQAHTPHGLGTITEVDTVRGRSSFRVAGTGFNVWVDETKLRVATNPWGASYDIRTTVDSGVHNVNKDNSTVLPYDYTPQYPVDMFRQDQNIQPGDHEIDAEDRLRSSDSLSGDSAGANRPYPGPNPDLFAKGASFNHRYAEDHYTDVDHVEDAEGHLTHFPDDGQWYTDECDPTGGPPQDLQQGPPPEKEARRYYGEFEDDPSCPDWGDDDWHKGLPEGPERTLSEHAAGRHDRDGGAWIAWQGEHGKHEKDENKHNKHEKEGWFDRPAGLSHRYAYLEPEIDQGSPVVAFRRDPVAFIEAAAYLGSSEYDDDALEARYGSYAELLSADRLMKTGKWADVRAKALRLRKDGKVHVHDVDFDRIYASVDGDHATYDVMIKKGSDYGLGGQTISNWHCGCDWGAWAFKRRYSYIGRLCSHGYAAYLEMQSRHMKDNPQHFAPKKFFVAATGHLAGVVEDYKKFLDENGYGPEPASVADFVNTSEDNFTDDQVEQLYDYVHEHPVKVPERQFDIDYTFDPDKVYKQSDLLRTEPRGLHPMLRQVPPPADSEMVDVTKDERKTTGPDQIVHFSNLQQQIVASLHQGAGGISPAHPGPQGGPSAPGTGWVGPPPPTGATEQQMQALQTLRNRTNNPNAQIGQTGQQQPSTQAQTQSQATQPGSTNVPAINQPTDRGGGVFTPDNPLAGTHGMTEQLPGPGGSGVGAAPGGTVGTGKGYGGAGFQSGGNWLKSQETTGINPGGQYQVQSGDTLGDIARRSGQSVNDLMRANPNIKDPSLITPEMNLKIPGQGPGPAGTGGVTAPTGLPAASSAPTNPAISQGLSQGRSENIPGLPPPKAPATPPPAQSPAAPKTPEFQGLKTTGGRRGRRYAQGSDIHGQGGSLPPAKTKTNTSATTDDDEDTDDDNDPNKKNVSKSPGASSNNAPSQPTPPPATPSAASPPPGMGTGAGGMGSAFSSAIPSAMGAAGQALNALPNVTNFAPWANMIAGPLRGGIPGLGGGLGGLMHLFGAADNDDDDPRPDTGEAAGDLDKLRDLSDESPDEHYQHMDSYNQEVADLVCDLEEAGVGASPFVAMLHGGGSNPMDMLDRPPNWFDEHGAGTGNVPKGYISDSQSYLDAHEAQDIRNLLAEPPDDTPIIKHNDGRSKPPQGPREGRRLHYAEGDPSGGGDATATGYFNPDNPTDEDWEAGSGNEFMQSLKDNAQQAGQGLSNMPGGGGGGGGAEGGEAGGEAAAAEEALPLVAVANRGFSLEAFDRGEFAPVGWDGGGGVTQYGGELRRASRVGGGPTQQVRIDPGMRRGNQVTSHETYANVMNDQFGNNGEPELTEYAETPATPMNSGMVEAQRNIYATVYGSSTPQPGSVDDFASSPYVQGMLRTAGRKFTPEEQRELEAEFHPQGARNLPTDDDLEGTHYLMGL